MRQVKLSALKQVFAVGSGSWDWQEEHRRLMKDWRTQDLMKSIEAVGVKEPILLGSDGRVWDGHHRIVAATQLGISHVPVVFSGGAK